jgi:glycosyltransferase involved in cell wall biosynthesis
MKFGIITHAIHKMKNGQIYAYEPYVREMNLWAIHVGEIRVVAPLSVEPNTHIDEAYIHQKITICKIANLNIIGLINKIRTIILVPDILFKIFKTMFWADHIHLRCPGNIGLLGCFVQLFFPFKQKTVKYAGNWDPKSKQPFSYRLQKWIISNTVLTKNCNVLVYGDWPNQSKNIIPFFTASYSENEILEIPQKTLLKKIKLIFVGSFSKGKQPLKSIQVLEKLLKGGYEVELHMYGAGNEFETVKGYVKNRKLSAHVFLHNNQPKEIVKKAFQESHFLVFISKSEGWPKVVAEAMFWSCLPVSTSVSCVPGMLDHGNRGAIVTDDIYEISSSIEQFINHEEKYLSAIENAKQWSQQFTLEKFEKEIKKLL